jgi:hypothetical protein
MTSETIDFKLISSGWLVCYSLVLSDTLCIVNMKISSDVKCEESIQIVHIL